MTLTSGGKRSIINVEESAWKKGKRCRNSRLLLEYGMARAIMDGKELEEVMQKGSSGNGNAYLSWTIKRLVLVLFDVVAVNLSYYLALVVRFYVNNEFRAIAQTDYLPAFWQFAPYYSFICVMVFAAFKLYNNRWTYAGLHDLNWLFAANVVTAAIHVAGTLLFVQRMPITYYVIGAMLQFVLTAVSRFAYRFAVMESTRLSVRNRTSLNVMIVGTGETARILRGQIENDSANVAHPVCIFSYKDTQNGTMMNGLPIVTGLDKLPEQLRKYQIKCVMLADALMPADIRMQIREICQTSEVEVQNFSGFMTGEGSSLTAKKLLEYTSGPVDVVVNGLTASFENGEKALMNLNGNYHVQRICAKDGRLVVFLTVETVILNDVQKAWVREEEEKEGKEISFF